MQNLPAEINSGLKDLTIACLSHDPRRRPSGEQLCHNLKLLNRGRKLDLPDPSSAVAEQPDPDTAWAQPLLDGFNAFSMTWSTGIDQLSSTILGEQKKEDSPKSKSDATSNSKEQPMDQHGYAKVSTAEEEIANAEELSRPASNHSIPRASAPKSMNSSQLSRRLDSESEEEEEEDVTPPNSAPGQSKGLQSRSKKWLDRMRAVERQAQLNNGFAPEHITRSSSSQGGGANGDTTSEDDQTTKEEVLDEADILPASSASAAKGNFKKTAKLEWLFGSKKKDVPKAKQGSQTDTFRQTDKAVLKAHRETVHKGRQDQLNKGGSSDFLVIVSVEHIYIWCDREVQRTQRRSLSEMHRCG